MHGVSVLRDKQGAVQFKPFLDNWNWKLLGQTMHVYQVAFLKVEEMKNNKWMFSFYFFCQPGNRVCTLSFQLSIFRLKK